MGSSWKCESESATGLCRLPRQRSGEAVTCQMFHERPVGELRKMCLSTATERTEGVLVTQVTVDSHVTKQPPHNISLVCPKSPMGLSTNVPGALEINVPVNCI